MKKIFTLLFLFLAIAIGNASHIAGGEIYYKYLGSNNYEITVKIYFDCQNGSASAIASDQEISVGFFNQNNSLITSNLVTGGPAEILTDVNYNCIVPPTGNCVSRVTYVFTVNLPTSPGGYKAVFQRCCRNAAIQNLVGPSTIGATFFTQIPDLSVTGNNSSPVFVKSPPAYVCNGYPFNFDHKATDLDGDSLVYELYTPFDGADQANANPEPPNAPPFLPVTWQTPYAEQNPFNTAAALSINPQTGFMTVIPNGLGVFVVGVKVKEYRNGVLIGETYRDYQYNVINCQFTTVSAFLTPQYQCSNTVSFANNSIATTYLWDFGVSGTTTDTSTAFEPTYTYQNYGTYTVTLIAFDSSCTDTNTAQITIFEELMVTAGNDSSFCVGDEITLGSSQLGGLPATFLWSPATGLSDPTIINPVANPAQTTTYILTATLGTCVKTDTVVVTVNTKPNLSFSFEEAASCLEALIKIDNTSTNTDSYKWDIGGLLSLTDPEPQFTLQLGDSIQITLIGKKGNCPDTLVKTYTTQSKSPLKSPLPNIFTPNGDGLNECYTPAEVTSSTQCYDIYIYNRWGQLVYDKAEDGDCWNGSHRNKGGNVTDGVYFFVLYLDGKKKEGGTITVSR